MLPGLDMPAMIATLDYISMMTYDFHGACEWRSEQYRLCEGSVCMGSSPNARRVSGSACT